MNSELMQLALELTLKSTLILGLAWLAASFLARRAAAERHLIWLAAILALLTLPPLMLTAPGIAVPLSWFDLDTDRPAASIGTETSRSSASTSSRTARAVNDVSDAAAAQAETSDEQVGEVANRTASRYVLGPLTAVGWNRVVVAALTLYLAIACVILIRFTSRTWRVLDRARGLVPITNVDTLRLVDSTRRELGVRRPVRALRAAGDLTPWAFGLIRPAIVLPEDFEAWPQEQRANAAIHELAHVSRLDQLTLWLSQLCAALYWIHPLAWLAAAKLDREAERACDDRVLLAGGSRASYAHQLLAIANKIYGAPAAPLPATAMARSSMIGERIRSILDSNTRRTTMTRLKSALLILASLALLGPIATLKSQGIQAPANDEELAQAVRSYLDADRTDSAVAVLSDWIANHPGCSYCADLLRLPLPSRPVDEFLAIQQAFDDIERRALESSNGEPLVKLATIALRSKSDDAIDFGQHYLYEAHTIGNVGPNAPWIVLQYLIEMGRLEDAQTYIAQVQQDETLTEPQNQSLRQWNSYIDVLVARNRELTRRLTGAEPAGGPSEYVPVHKAAPMYPQRAAAAGLEGSVVVEYTVTELGHTKNPFIVESTNSLFDQPTLDSVAQYRYLPRTVGGSGVEVPGVRTKVNFALQGDN